MSFFRERRRGAGFPPDGECLERHGDLDGLDRFPDGFPRFVDVAVGLQQESDDAPVSAERREDQGRVLHTVLRNT